MICGFLTNCCVESTMRSAYERGLDVFVLTDCCAAMGQAAHEASVEHNLPLFSVPCLGSEVEFEGPRRTAGSSSEPAWRVRVPCSAEAIGQRVARGSRPPARTRAIVYRSKLKEQRESCAI